MKIQNPFNPGKPAKPQELVGRGEQIHDFESFLASTTHESPMNMAVVGVRGIGKTSLLSKFEETVLAKNCIAIRIDAEEGRFSSVPDLYEEILGSLHAELKRRSFAMKWGGKIKDFLNSFSFEISYSDVGLAIRGKEKNNEYVPSVFREKMLELWSNIKTDVPAVVILIDEAEFLEGITGSLMALRNMFSRLAEKGCGYMVVLSGRMTFHQEMSDLFSPLTRFFHLEKLERLTHKDVKKLLDIELSKTNVKIKDICLEKIIDDSEGHPYVVNVMGYILYDKLKEDEKVITLNHYNRYFEDIVRYLSLDLFDGMYRKVADAEKPVLFEVAKAGKEVSMSQIAKNMKIKAGLISTSLKRLTDKNCLLKVKRGEYIIFHKLFRYYLLKKLQTE